MASSHPQAACTSLTKSLQSEWNFTIRVNVGCSVLMNDLEHCLSFVFLPSLFGVDKGVEVNATERELSGIPLNH